MSESLTLDDRKAIDAGTKADAILHDPVFVAAAQKIEAKVIEKWRLSVDPAVREECWAMQRALQAIQQELQQTIDAGFVATARSRRITSR